MELEFALLRGSTILLFLPSIAFSQWQTGGIPICTAIEEQHDVHTLKDGNGGAYFIWQDARNGSSNNPMYAQHVNNNGINQLANNGIPLSTLGSQIYRDIIGTNDGFILAWLDSRGMILQRYDAGASEVWSPNGIKVCNYGGAGLKICASVLSLTLLDIC